MSHILRPDSINLNETDRNLMVSRNPGLENESESSIGSAQLEGGEVSLIDNP